MIVRPGTFFLGDLIGFTTALLITLLLLVLTLRAAKLPGTPVANIVFSISVLLWSAGGLAHAALLASRIPVDSHSTLLAQAIQSTGAAAFPIPILAAWGSLVKERWQKRAIGALQAVACVSAVLITALVWSAPNLNSGPLSLFTGTQFTASPAALLLVLGAGVSLRRRSAPRAVFLASLAIVATVCAAALAMAVGNQPAFAEYSQWFAFIGAHLVLLMVLCGFFLFARFRFADIFIRYGVRIMLAGAWAATIGIFAFAGQTPLLGTLMHHGLSAPAAHVISVIFVANVLLLSFTFVDERISAAAHRWLFHAPDYRAETRKLGRRLRDLDLDPEIGAAVEDAARQPLELAAALVAAVDIVAPADWPAGLLEGETVELDRANPLLGRLPVANVEVLVPIASDGRVTHVLMVSPGHARPGLVSRDLNYLRSIATQCGNRLDQLRREREAIERQSRESLLEQQVTEAELRALRAQINPHFLFNCLNTIADLIVRDPSRAEAMTLRLASVFRHVLAQSSRPLTAIHEEMEFLRTYLYIEEARFGDRLKVEIAVAPAVAGEQIPSLILQPLVENALKHGLGPKPGPGRLWISAEAHGDRVRLRVEDDGIGPNGRHSRAAIDPSRPQGLGLANIAERLNTLYHDRASVRLEPREGGGSRATVLIPRGDGVAV